MSARQLGVVLPLWSLRRPNDWGIGDLSALAENAAFFAEAGCSLVQVLPPHPLGGHETSPYGARSAFAIDPVYLDLARLPEVPAGVVGTPSPLPSSDRVHYPEVRARKQAALKRAIDWFRDHGGATDPGFKAFLSQDWVMPYAQYAALSEQHQGRSAQTWSASVTPEQSLVTEHCVAQYFCDLQWKAMRRALAARGIMLMGDVPFILGADSADVWSRREAFRHDVSLGCPPDPFSATGQDWSLPAYAFGPHAMAFLGARAARASELYDRYRVDHVVGYFRQWLWKTRSEGSFDVGIEHEQEVRGRDVLKCMQNASKPDAVIAEDLGVIPPFVRETLRTLGIPGYKVIPWERNDLGLRDPRAFDACSVTTYGTHDTEPLQAWVQSMPVHEREQLRKMAAPRSTENEETALLRLAMESGSDLTLLLFTEILGTEARINTPGTVADANWTLRLPQGFEKATARLQMVRELAHAAGRCAIPATGDTRATSVHEA